MVGVHHKDNNSNNNKDIRIRINNTHSNNSNSSSRDKINTILLIWPKIHQNSNSQWTRNPYLRAGQNTLIPTLDGLTTTTLRNKSPHGIDQKHRARLPKKRASRKNKIRPNRSWMIFQHRSLIQRHQQKEDWCLERDQMDNNNNRPELKT